MKLYDIDGNEFVAANTRFPKFSYRGGRHWESESKTIDDQEMLFYFEAMRGRLYYFTWNDKNYKVQIVNDPVKGTAGIGDASRLWTDRWTALAAKQAVESQKKKEAEDLIWESSLRVYNYLSDLYPDLERNPYRSPRLYYIYLELEEFDYCHIALERTWMSSRGNEDLCRVVVTIPVRGSSGGYRSFVTKSIAESKAREMYACVLAEAKEGK